MSAVARVISLVPKLRLSNRVIWMPSLQATSCRDGIRYREGPEWYYEAGLYQHQHSVWSLLGVNAATQSILDSCVKHGITLDIESIRIDTNYRRILSGGTD